jgi:hypothetical protein
LAFRRRPARRRHQQGLCAPAHLEGADQVRLEDTAILVLGVAGRGLAHVGTHVVHEDVQIAEALAELLEQLGSTRGQADVGGAAVGALAVPGRCPLFEAALEARCVASDDEDASTEAEQLLGHCLPDAPCATGDQSARTLELPARSARYTTAWSSPAS